MALIYLPLMVIAPYWHLALDNAGNPDRSPCSHTSGDNHSPAENHGEQHDQDSCLFCRLITTPAASPEASIIAHILLIEAPVFMEPNVSFSPCVRAPAQARAPPFPTV